MANYTKPFMTKFNLKSGLTNSPKLLQGLNITATFLLVCFSGFFFGPHKLRDSFMMIGNLTDFSHPGKILIPLIKNNDFLLGILLIIFMLWFEYPIAKTSFAVKFLSKPLFLRYTAYLIMVVFLLVFGVFSSQNFFYLQF